MKHFAVKKGEKSMPKVVPGLPYFSLKYPLKLLYLIFSPQTARAEHATPLHRFIKIYFIIGRLLNQVYFVFSPEA